MSIPYRVFLVILVVFCSVTRVSAQTESAESSADQQAIKESVKGYLAAHAARDVKKLIGYWSPEGVYINRSTGEQVSGHEALEAAFKANFEENPAKLGLATTSIEFISPNVALERGVATVTSESETVESDYTVVYVKRGGKWLVDRVTEEDIVRPTSHYEQLKPLAWLVGDWVDDAGDVRLEFSCNWTRNNNFLSRTYKAINDQGTQSSGLQIIGWDAAAKQIRSWLFDSDGGFVLGSWKQRGDKWMVTSVATLAGGERGSFTSVFEPLDDGTFLWQKVNRVLDGELLPNVNETIVRPLSTDAGN